MGTAGTPSQGFDPTDEKFVREFVVQRPTGGSNPYNDGKPAKSSGLFRGFWVQAAGLVLIIGLLCYARAFQVCTEMKNTGRFYSTMNFDRCIRIAVRSPHFTLKQHLAVINERS